jgi:hypothetical protein
MPEEEEPRNPEKKRNVDGGVVVSVQKEENEIPAPSLESDSETAPTEEQRRRKVRNPNPQPTQHGTRPGRRRRVGGLETPIKVQKLLSYTEQVVQYVLGIANSHEFTYPFHCQLDLVKLVSEVGKLSDYDEIETHVQAELEKYMRCSRGMIKLNIEAEVRTLKKRQPRPGFFHEEINNIPEIVDIMNTPTTEAFQTSVKEARRLLNKYRHHLVIALANEFKDNAKRMLYGTPDTQQTTEATDDRIEKHTKNFITESDTVEGLGTINNIWRLQLLRLALETYDLDPTHMFDLIVLKAEDKKFFHEQQLKIIQIKVLKQNALADPNVDDKTSAYIETRYKHVMAELISAKRNPRDFDDFDILLRKLTDPTKTDQDLSQYALEVFVKKAKKLTSIHSRTSQAVKELVNERIQIETNTFREKISTRSGLLAFDTAVKFGLIRLALVIRLTHSNQFLDFSECPDVQSEYAKRLNIITDVKEKTKKLVSESEDVAVAKIKDVQVAFLQTALNPEIDITAAEEQYWEQVKTLRTTIQEKYLTFLRDQFDQIIQNRYKTAIEHDRVIAANEIAKQFISLAEQYMLTSELVARYMRMLRQELHEGDKKAIHDYMTTNLQEFTKNINGDLLRGMMKKLDAEKNTASDVSIVGQTRLKFNDVLQSSKFQRKQEDVWEGSTKQQGGMDVDTVQSPPPAQQTQEPISDVLLEFMAHPSFPLAPVEMVVDKPPSQSTTQQTLTKTAERLQERLTVKVYDRPPVLHPPPMFTKQEWAHELPPTQKTQEPISDVLLEFIAHPSFLPAPVEMVVDKPPLQTTTQQALTKTTERTLEKTDVKVFDRPPMFHPPLVFTKQHWAHETRTLPPPDTTLAALLQSLQLNHMQYAKERELPTLQKQATDTRLLPIDEVLAAVQTLPPPPLYSMLLDQPKQLFKEKQSDAPPPLVVPTRDNTRIPALTLQVVAQPTATEAQLLVSQQTPTKELDDVVLSFTSVLPAPPVPAMLLDVPMPTATAQQTEFPEQTGTHALPDVTYKPNPTWSLVTQPTATEQQLLKQPNDLLLSFPSTSTTVSAAQPTETNEMLQRLLSALQSQPTSQAIQQQPPLTCLREPDVAAETRILSDPQTSAILDPLFPIKDPSPLYPPLTQTQEPQQQNTPSDTVAVSLGSSVLTQTKPAVVAEPTSTVGTDILQALQFNGPIGDQRWTTVKERDILTREHDPLLRWRERTHPFAPMPSFVPEPSAMGRLQQADPVLVNTTTLVKERAPLTFVKEPVPSMIHGDPTTVFTFPSVASVTRPLIVAEPERTTVDPIIFKRGLVTQQQPPIVLTHEPVAMELEHDPITTTPIPMVSSPTFLTFVPEEGQVEAVVDPTYVAHLLAAPVRTVTMTHEPMQTDVALADPLVSTAVWTHEPLSFVPESHTHVADPLYTHTAQTTTMQSVTVTAEPPTQTMTVVPDPHITLLSSTATSTNPLTFLREPTQTGYGADPVYVTTTQPRATAIATTLREPTQTMTETTDPITSLLTARATPTKTPTLLHEPLQTAYSTDPVYVTTTHPSVTAVATALREPTQIVTETPDPLTTLVSPTATPMATLTFLREATQTDHSTDPVYVTTAQPTAAAVITRLREPTQTMTETMDPITSLFTPMTTPTETLTFLREPLQTDHIVDPIHIQISDPIVTALATVTREPTQVMTKVTDPIASLRPSMATSTTTLNFLREPGQMQDVFDPISVGYMHATPLQFGTLTREPSWGSGVVEPLARPLTVTPPSHPLTPVHEPIQTTTLTQEPAQVETAHVETATAMELDETETTTAQPLAFIHEPEIVDIPTLTTSYWLDDVSRLTFVRESRVVDPVEDRLAVLQNPLVAQQTLFNVREPVETAVKIATEQGTTTDVIAIPKPPATQTKTAQAFGTYVGTLTATKTNVGTDEDTKTDVGPQVIAIPKPPATQTKTAQAFGTYVGTLTATKTNVGTDEDMKTDVGPQVIAIPKPPATQTKTAHAEAVGTDVATLTAMKTNVGTDEDTKTDVGPQVIAIPKPPATQTKTAHAEAVGTDVATLTAMKTNVGTDEDTKTDVGPQVIAIPKPPAIQTKTAQAFGTYEGTLTAMKTNVGTDEDTKTDVGPQVMTKTKTKKMQTKTIYEEATDERAVATPMIPQTHTATAVKSDTALATKTATAVHSQVATATKTKTNVLQRVVPTIHTQHVSSPDKQSTKTQVFVKVATITKRRLDELYDVVITKSKDRVVIESLVQTISEMVAVKTREMLADRTMTKTITLVRTKALEAITAYFERLAERETDQTALLALCVLSRVYEPAIQKTVHLINRIAQRFTQQQRTSIAEMLAFQQHTKDMTFAKTIRGTIIEHLDRSVPDITPRINKTIDNVIAPLKPPEGIKLLPFPTDATLPKSLDRLFGDNEEDTDHMGQATQDDSHIDHQASVRHGHEQTKEAWVEESGRPHRAFVMFGKVFYFANIAPL